MLVNSLNEAEKKQIIDYCFHRYGLNRELWDSRVLIKTKDAIWVINKEMYKFALHSDVEFESLGLRCFSGQEFPYKITDGIYKIFGDEIKKGCLLLDKDAAISMLRGESLRKSEWGDYSFDGYVLLFLGKVFIGIGLKKGDLLTSQIPKSLRSQLGKNLEIRDE